MLGTMAGFDIVAQDRDGRLTALVEVKRRLGTTASWATELRSNMLMRRGLPAADLFLIVLPDRLFIWRSSAPPETPPFEIDARPLLGPYFERVGIAPEQISPFAFRMLVYWWLADLAQTPPASAPPELSVAGLLDALSGAELSHEAEA